MGVVLNIYKLKNKTYFMTKVLLAITATRKKYTNMLKMGSKYIAILF